MFDYNVMWNIKCTTTVSVMLMYVYICGGWRGMLNLGIDAVWTCIIIYWYEMCIFCVWTNIWFIVNSLIDMFNNVNFCVVHRAVKCGQGCDVWKLLISQLFVQTSAQIVTILQKSLHVLTLRVRNQLGCCAGLPEISIASWMLSDCHCWLYCFIWVFTEACSTLSTAGSDDSLDNPYW